MAGYRDPVATTDPTVHCRAILSRIDPGAAIRVQGTAHMTFGLAVRGEGADATTAGRRSPFLFHGRIDNRSELCDLLGLSGGERQSLSDDDLAARCWDLFGDRIADRLAGDYAFAHWDETDRLLTLARGPLSTRTIFYAARDERLAFATAPQGLSGLAWIEWRPDLHYCAQILSRARLGDCDRTIFSGIRAVRPGFAVTIGERVTTRRLWRPQIVAMPSSLKAIGEGLRFELDRAVAARLPAGDAVTACQLSGGRDSSAVFASAATQARHPLVAITGAPRAGFQARAAGRNADEAALAAETAARFPAARHRVVRSSPIAKAGAYFEPLQRASVAPLLTPTNAPWWMETIECARQMGAAVMLTGEMGNFSLSNGGVDAIDRFWREGSLSRYVRVGRHAAGLRGLMLAMLATALPRGGYEALRRLSGRPSHRLAITILNPPWRHIAETLANEGLDLRPTTDFRRETELELFAADQGDPFTLIGWGIDIRDPSADRRLVDYCYSLPAFALTSADGNLPAFEAAFADRLPRAVLRPAERGWQQLDWFELFDPEDLRGLFRTFHAHPAVADLLDLGEIERLLDEWPRGTSWMQDRRRFADISDLYRNRVMLALSVAHFIVLHFPSTGRDDQPKVATQL